LFERVDRLAILLQFHGGDTEIAQDLPRRGFRVSSLKLSVGLLVACTIRILNEVDTSAEMLARLVSNNHFARGRPFFLTLISWNSGTFSSRNVDESERAASCG